DDPMARSGHRSRRDGPAKLGPRPLRNASVRLRSRNLKLRCAFDQFFLQCFTGPSAVALQHATNGWVTASTNKNVKDGVHLVYLFWMTGRGGWFPTGWRGASGWRPSSDAGHLGPSRARPSLSWQGMTDNAAKVFGNVAEMAALAGVSKRTVWRDVK